MSIITTLTRMWLTRSCQPFRFTNQPTPQLSYADCRNLGLYVHIPFCRSLCSFCPYCKIRYDQSQCEAYIAALLQEIQLVVRQNQQPGRPKQVSSLYFGGGTPALALPHLPRIIETLREHFQITEGIGLELHPADVTVPVLQALRQSGVDKISIGVQSFQPKFQQLLGRQPVNAAAMAQALAAVPFATVSMDFIFALPGQNLADLQADVEAAFQCGANHIAIYPFIDFTFTKSRLPAMPKKQKRRLLDDITNYLLARGCTRNSIWTFASQPNAAYSSMTRDNFLGFGCSATTLLPEQFKINTFSVPEYIRTIKEGRLPTSLTLRFSQRQRMLYYLFWTAYSTRVPAADFEAFFGVPLRKMYGAELQLAKWLVFITEQNGVYSLTLKGAFYYHYYENFYTLAYIDKMWGLMREQAWPEKLEL